MPQQRQNRHLLHPHHERSRKALRHHRHHSVWQTPCRRHPRAASRQVRRARPRGNLRQSRRSPLRPRGGQLTCPCATSASSIARISSKVSATAAPSSPPSSSRSSCFPCSASVSAPWRSAWSAKPRKRLPKSCFAAAKTRPPLSKV